MPLQKARENAIMQIQALAWHSVSVNGAAAEAFAGIPVSWELSRWGEGVWAMDVVVHSFPHVAASEA